MKQAQVTEVMNDRLAQELLNSNIPARLAYTGLDGFPRAIPIGFLWDGTRFVIGTATNSPKMQALSANPNVALTIDTNTFPPHVLYDDAPVLALDMTEHELLDNANDRRAVLSAVRSAFAALGSH